MELSVCSSLTRFKGLQASINEDYKDGDWAPLAPNTAYLRQRNR
jgi:hypothetical protein